MWPHQRAPDNNRPLFWRVSSYNYSDDSFLTAINHSQPFWANVVASNGAGPKPLPYAKLSTDALADAIDFCLSPAARESAQRIAEQMRQENGVQTAVESLHRHLPVDELRCSLLPDLVARWVYVTKSKKAKHPTIRLSEEALATLIKEKKLKMSDVQP